MKIYTKIVVQDWGLSSFRTTAEYYEYDGPVVECKGATKQEKDLNAAQSDFYKTLTADYTKQFAQQAAILGAINSVAQPILAAGPNQYGFSKAEDVTLRTQASEGTAAEYQAARKATQEQLAAQGGGNAFLPSGAADQISADINTRAAESEAGKDLSITEAGYTQGRQNYAEAANMESGAAGLLNPTGYAGQATGAGESAFQGASMIQQQDQAASPWGAIGGLLGGAAGAFLDPFGSALGSKAGKVINF